MTMIKVLICALFGISLSTPKLLALSYQSCGEVFTLSKAPGRIISIDINTTETLLKLGLASKMIGVAGIEDKDAVLPELKDALARIPQIPASYPTLEALVALRPEFIYAGWQYGFSLSSGLTPKRLRKHGIASYALNESCIRIQTRPDIGFEDVYTDIMTLGQVFDVQARAEELVRGFKAQEAQLLKRKLKRKPRIFLYDSGEASPFTAGRYAIPTAMIRAAGASNIFDDIETSWTNVSWENVIARGPEFIIVVDYGNKNAATKLAFLQKKLGNKGVPAVEQKRFLILPYAAVTPGIRTLDATVELQNALHVL